MLFVAVAAVLAQCTSVARRVDCGYVNITQADCLARGCCYSEEGGPSCFYKTSGVPITKVHVIQSNHFDAGYTAQTSEVINEYFTKYFPTAASVGKALKAKDGPAQLRWMTQSYLADLYLNCPEGLDLVCPSEAEKAAFKEAVQDGFITWHAFAHNAELAAMHPTMIGVGVKMTHDLDDALNVSRKAVLSQRDVPGLPRGSIRHLAAQGVRGLSIGGNGRVNPPNVPPAFLWKDLSAATGFPGYPWVDQSSSNQTILTLWHGYGYGEMDSNGYWAPEIEVDPALGSTKESCRLELPNFAEAAVYAWRDDNSGPPPDTNTVETMFAQIQGWYPNATIVASDLDAYMAAIHEAGDKVLGALPVVTEDLSDTWIMGVQSDPWKTSMARAFERSYAQGGGNDPEAYKAAKLAVKNGEHTWGLHISAYGPWQDKGWTNEEFHRMLDEKNPYLENLSRSWVQQRDYGIRKPLSLLTPGSPIDTLMSAEVERIAPWAGLNLSSLTPAASNSTLTLGWAQVTLRDSGAVADIVDKAAGRTVKGVFGEFVYQTLNDDVFAAWRADYLLAGSGGASEYGKPGVTPAISKNATYTAAGAKWYTDSLTTLVAVVEMDASLVSNYGAPVAVWVKYDFAQVGKVGLGVQFVNKTATRLPEASYVRFAPTLQQGEYWLMDKLGSWTSPLDVLDGSSKGLHATTTGVAFGTPSQSTYIASLDSSLLRWGPGLYPFCAPMRGSIDPSQGAAYILHDNSWNTNYPYWYPFSDAPDGTTATLKWDFEVLL
eukprot:TRINITY_DN20385_c0_g1_i1.p1 TRINITY_DN20385_c0_g1~~TRINITY_DN20385_c0_g1_i1.p1  ORF type:complete len:771 (+),score=233.56 TRINITY_DN20385_c0_g1_i1:113-2425(+)